MFNQEFEIYNYHLTLNQKQMNLQPIREMMAEHNVKAIDNLLFLKNKEQEVINTLNEYSRHHKKMYHPELFIKSEGKITGVPKQVIKTLSEKFGSHYHEDKDGFLGYDFTKIQVAENFKIKIQSI